MLHITDVGSAALAHATRRTSGSWPPSASACARTARGPVDESGADRTPGDAPFGMYSTTLLDALADIELHAADKVRCSTPTPAPGEPRPRPTMPNRDGRAIVTSGRTSSMQRDAADPATRGTERPGRAPDPPPEDRPLFTHCTSASAGQSICELTDQQARPGPALPARQRRCQPATVPISRRITTAAIAARPAQTVHPRHRAPSRRPLVSTNAPWHRGGLHREPVPENTPPAITARGWCAVNAASAGDRRRARRRGTPARERCRPATGSCRNTPTHTTRCPPGLSRFNPTCRRLPAVFPPRRLRSGATAAESRTGRRRAPA